MPQNYCVGRRVGLSALAVLAAAVPYLAFRLSGISLLETFWEFACYRYFEAINSFEQTTLPFWVVQGFPMALLQSALLKAFLYFDMASIGTTDQIERFAQASTLMAYILIAAALVIAVNLERMRSADGMMLIATMLALFPMTRWFDYFFAPEYWIFELPLAIVSAAWTMVALRETEDETPQQVLWRVVLAGMWMALCFTQKPSLAGLGGLPILLGIALPRGHLIGKSIRVALLVPSFIITHRFIMLASNKFDFALTETATRNYWDFLFGSAAVSPSTGNGLTLNIWPLIQSAGYLVSPILLGVAVLCGGITAAYFFGHRRKAIVAGSLFFGLVFAHLLVIAARPARTSVIDLAIYGAMLVPISVALMPALPRYRLLGIAALGVAVVAAMPNICPDATQPSPLVSRIDEASAYEKSVGRPVSVIVHDNRAHPLTLEALALYTGQLQPLVPGYTDLRKAFLGDAKLLTTLSTDEQLQEAIAAGRLIVWGSAPNAPDVETSFPSIAALTKNADAVQHQIEMLPGWFVTRFAYVKNRSIEATR